MAPPTEEWILEKAEEVFAEQEGAFPYPDALANMGEVKLFEAQFSATSPAGYLAVVAPGDNKDNRYANQPAFLWMIIGWDIGDEWIVYWADQWYDVTAVENRTCKNRQDAIVQFDKCNRGTCQFYYAIRALDRERDYVVLYEHWDFDHSASADFPTLYQTGDTISRMTEVRSVDLGEADTYLLLSEKTISSYKGKDRELHQVIQATRWHPQEDHSYHPAQSSKYPAALNDFVSELQFALQKQDKTRVLSLVDEASIQEQLNDMMQGDDDLFIKELLCGQPKAPDQSYQCIPLSEVRSAERLYTARLDTYLYITVLEIKTSSGKTIPVEFTIIPEPNNPAEFKIQSARG